MAVFVRQTLWKNPGAPGLIAVTTNATVKLDGALVMGRGAARELKDRIDGIDLECGKIVKGIGGKYGFVIVRPPTEDKIGIGIFQVKKHFSDWADLALIEFSAKMLEGYAKLYPEVSIRLNYPGIGNGGLSRDKVEPLLKDLPHSVTICYL